MTQPRSPGLIKARRDQNPGVPKPLFPCALHAPDSGVRDEIPALTDSFKNAILGEVLFLCRGFLSRIVGAEQYQCHQAVVRIPGLAQPLARHSASWDMWAPRRSRGGTESRVLGQELLVESPTWESILSFPSCF